MPSAQLDKLTEVQRSSLRLVHSHYNSKEIAVIEGVSPSAIDKRIERAVQILGVDTRFQAARLLHDAEHGADDAVVGGYERVPSEPIDLLRPARPPASGAASGPLGLARRFLGLDPGSGIEGGARVRSTRTERFVRLVLITALVAVVSVALVSLMLTVTSILRSVRQDAPPGTTAVSGTVAPMEKHAMLKQRRQAAEIVTSQFLRAEKTADEAAEAAAACVTTLLQQRAAANLPVTVGLDALKLVADASADLIRARRRMVEAHGALLAVRSEIGLRAFYGDESECPPNTGELVQAEGLKLVA